MYCPYCGSDKPLVYHESETADKAPLITIVGCKACNPKAEPVHPSRRPASETNA